jgi:hypothetical protein
MNKRAVFEVLARHFAATGELGGGSRAAYLTVAKTRISLEIAAVGSRNAGRGTPAKPRLRFDKVAVRFVDDLRSALHEAVPNGKTLVLTVTAPIRQSGKTAAAFAERMRDGMARRSARLDIRETIEGNQIRARLVKAAGPAKVIGFVHNPGVDGTVLLGAAQAFLAAIEAAARKRAQGKSNGGHWLALVGEDGFADTYRHLCATCAPVAGFGKVLLVLADGRVESLAG